MTVGPENSDVTHACRNHTLQRLVEVIARLKALRYDEKHAAQVVERLLKGISTRPDDDAGGKALLKMLSS